MALAARLLAAKKANEKLGSRAEFQGFNQVLHSIKSGDNLDLAEQSIKGYEAELQALNAERVPDLVPHPQFDYLLHEPDDDYFFKFRGLSPEGARRMLTRHNSLRSLLEKYDTTMPVLTWSNELAERAQKWAEFLVFDRSGRDHSSPLDNRLLGKMPYETLENLAERTGINDVDKPEPVIMDWYSEIKECSYQMNPPARGTGHFWTIVCRRVRAMGGGMAKGLKSGKEVWVCQYEVSAGPSDTRMYIDWEVITPKVWASITSLK